MHWLVNERPLTLIFSHFPNVFDCSNASPEARTVLSLFLFLFFLSQKVLSIEHTIRIVSKMCQRGPEGCPAACGLSSDGYLAGKFKFITKNRWISQLPLKVNASIENRPDEVDGGRCTKTGVGLGRVNK